MEELLVVGSNGCVSGDELVELDRVPAHMTHGTRVRLLFGRVNRVEIIEALATLEVGHSFPGEASAFLALPAPYRNRFPVGTKITILGAVSEF